jgi:hypothetical protein
VGADGKEYRAFLVRPVASVPCDLQGFNAWASGNRYGERIAQNIARQLLNRSVTYLASWEEIVNGIDWVDWLNAHAQKAFGVNHVLQPRRGRSDASRSD